MADDTSNTPIGGSSADDTKTRKTVRLHTTTAPAPIADPLAARDTDTSNLEVLDDTQTRRTVKIKPIAPPTSTGMVQLPIDAENTNTRRTVVLRPQGGIASSNSDTNTRKTVVLRPQTSAADTETNTRKTVVLRPQTSAAPAAPVSDETVAVPKPDMKPQVAVPLPPAPAAEVSDETVAVPKPDMKPQVAVPLPPAPAAEVSDETVAVPKPKPSVLPEVALPEGDVEDDDQTVKIKRPTTAPRIGPRPMGAPLPKGGLGAPVRPGVPGMPGKATVALNTAALGKAPAPVSATPVKEVETTNTDTDDIKETVKLPLRPPTKPATPIAARTTAPKPVPTSAVPTSAVPTPVPPTSAPGAETVSLKQPDDEEEIILNPNEKANTNVENDATAEANEDVQDDIQLDSGSRTYEQHDAPVTSASPLYLVIGILTLALLLGITALTLTQYLDFEHKVQIYEHIPGLPHAK